MKNFNIKSLIAFGIALAITSIAYAGNEDRTGQAGASELLINPWAKSSGWGGVNTSSAHGIDAMFLNIAGLSFIDKTDISFTHTQWLKGSDININSVGIGVKAGESGAFGISVMSFDFGEVDITTVDIPEGGIGTFQPQYINIGIGYAKEFSNSIHGGLAIKIISESIADVSAQGVAFDAGIQYVTGFNEDKDDLSFGIALKNVGSPMRFEGDGLAVRGNAPLTGTVIAFEQRS
ncbi:MAG: PorV/PorQ family protein, partial [Bacteroidia bacterium]|nr:PorV/PorQ family protein [Bacteroidia bacterium]